MAFVSRLLASLVLTLAFVADVAAQAFPDKSIRMIVPHQAGSAADVAARLIAVRMGTELGQQIVIENMPGASGLAGVQSAMKAAPDGYTVIGTGDSVMTYVPQLNKNAKFDPLKDFEPITQLTIFDWVLIVHPDFPAKTVPDLIALAKAKPGEINFGSGGPASPQHMAMELFMSRTGTSMKHVPYRGVTGAVNDVVAGVIPVMFTGSALVQGLAGDNKVRILASAGSTRSDLAPNAPTIAETAAPGFTWSSYMVLLGLPGTPKPVLDRLHAATVTSVKDPAIADKLKAAGMRPVGNTPAEIRKQLADDWVRIEGIIKAANITLAQ